MKGYDLLEESKHHFLLKGPNGAKVKIAKNGLSSATSKKIMGMSKGGKVEYGASPGNTLDTQAVEAFKKAFQGDKDVQKPKEQSKKVAQVAQYADGGIVDEESQGQKPVDININVKQPEAQREPSSEGFMQTIGNALSGIAQTPIAKALLTGDTSHLAAPQEPAAQVAPVSATTPAVETQGQAPSSRNALSEIQTQQGQAPDMFQQISELKNTPTAGQSQAISDYQKGTSDALTQLDTQSQQLQNLEKGYEKGSEFANNYAAHEARREELLGQTKDIYNKISNFEFKPQTLFSGGSFLQNIGTALSVLAGGVSQGLTGAKTNPVMDFINKQIELDSERQKHEYGKLENQYSILRQQGHSEEETLAMMRANKLSAIQAMLHINESKTKNLQTKTALQQAQATLALQTDAAVKQAAIQSTLRSNLTGASEAPQRTGMLPVSDTSAQGLSSPKQVESTFKQIAKSVQYLVPNEKERPEAVKEIQRIKDTHKVANTLLKLFDKAVETRRDVSNIYNERASVSGLRQNLIPFLKEKEGTPREFEAHAAEKLFPNARDTDDQVQQKREAFINFMMNGSTSSLLDSHEIPYPQLKLGGRKL